MYLACDGVIQLGGVANVRPLVEPTTRALTRIGVTRALWIGLGCRVIFDHHTFGLDDVATAIAALHHVVGSDPGDATELRLVVSREDAELKYVTDLRVSVAVDSREGSITLHVTAVPRLFCRRVGEDDEQLAARLNASFLREQSGQAWLEERRAQLDQSTTYAMERIRNHQFFRGARLAVRAVCVAPCSPEELRAAREFGGPLYGFSEGEVVYLTLPLGPWTSAPSSSGAMPGSPNTVTSAFVGGTHTVTIGPPLPLEQPVIWEPYWEPLSAVEIERLQADPPAETLSDAIRERLQDSELHLDVLWDILAFVWEEVRAWRWRH